MGEDETPHTQQTRGGSCARGSTLARPFGLERGRHSVGAQPQLPHGKERAKLTTMLCDKTKLHAHRRCIDSLGAVDFPACARQRSRLRALARPNASEGDGGSTHEFGHAMRRSRSLQGGRRSEPSCQLVCSGGRGIMPHRYRNDLWDEPDPPHKFLQIRHAFLHPTKCPALRHWVKTNPRGTMS